MKPLRGFSSSLAHTFRALRHRDFRLFWTGQWISVTGTWMQITALSWLVYRTTSSPLALGLLAVARFGPSMAGSPLAGLLVDRFPKRRLVIFTQASSLLLATALALLTLTGWVRFWEILLVAFCQGGVDTLDMTARQTFQMDLVGSEDLQSAVSLNAAAFNSGRMVGPALAGVMMPMFGEGACFAINAGSYLAVLVSLFMLRVQTTAPRVADSLLDDLLEGLRYAWSEPGIRRVMACLVVTSLVGLSANTILPVLTRELLHSNSGGYGALLACTGVGAIIGALGAAARSTSQNAPRATALGLVAQGAGLLALGLSRNLVLSAAWMVLVGGAVALQLSSINSYLQTTAPPHLRGRVISIYVWLFAGLAPLGGFLMGWATEHASAAWTTLGAGAICSLAGLGFLALPLGVATPDRRR